MRCASCGTQLPQDALFCSSCGKRVELGSVLGVGTDLPPVPPLSQEGRPTRADRPARATHPAAQRGAPEPQEQWQDGDHRASGGTFSVGRIAAMVATFVVLTILGTFALSQIFGSNAPETPAASSTTTDEPVTESPTPGSSVLPGTPESSAPAPSATPSTTPSPSPSATLPAGARKCSTSGSDAVATAYGGNKDTSCAFSNAVRAAYRKAGAPVAPESFRTYSTVTKKWYVVTCGEGSLVRCASANGEAVVFLGP